MRILKDVLKSKMTAIILWCVFAAVSLAVFLLYRISLEPFYYAGAVTLFFLLVSIAANVMTERKRSKERAYTVSSILSEWKNLPESESLREEDYQRMITALGEEMERLSTGYSIERQDTLDYYTAWVHQIKTPIAVMKFKLSEDTEEHRALNAELFRIEQYVDMVLQYLRLGSESSDLVIREYPVDELIRETLRKFAPQFIDKKLRLDFGPTERVTVTDKKWFLCILEQLISNAIKYTAEGTISVYAEENRLVVEDTGIGIAPEDLPRIFEKGFTGNNGRIGEKSSGLGLYLARKAAELLAVTLKAESAPRKGSRFTIQLKDTAR